MDFANEYPATDDDQNPGSEDDNQLDDSFVPDETTDPPASQQTSVEPDAAYKGLQRVLAKEQARARELETRIQQMSSQPADTTNQQIISGLINEIAATDPERARQLATNYVALQTSNENQRLRMQQVEAEQNRTIQQAAERNMQELRDLAADLGADPDAPSIDYGDDTEWIAERIAKVRASAKEAVKKVKPVTPPARTANETHSTQQGTPPQAAARAKANETVTEADVQAAQAAYARASAADKPAAEAKMRELSNKLAAQLFS